MRDFAVEKVIRKCEKSDGGRKKNENHAAGVLITRPFLTVYWQVLFKLLTIQHGKRLKKRPLLKSFWAILRF
jgi:hypothetical protein